MDLWDWLNRPKSILVFPTYAHRAGGVAGANWMVHLRVWLGRAREIDGFGQLIARAVDDDGSLDAAEIALLGVRMADFTADNDSREKVRFRFPGDPRAEVLKFDDRTDPNGLAEQTFTISAARMREISAAQGGTDGWLNVLAEVDEFSGEGRIKLLEPEGLSIVSDIDDTVKVTEIPAGPAIVLRNTFLRDYVAAAEMRELYRGYGPAAAFHYVSGGPWQLFRPVETFLIDQEKFPPGTFHMKNVRRDLRDKNSWKDLKVLLGGGSTQEHKIDRISKLMQACPKRKFILVGDSGEHDPEIYAQIRTMFPKQVQEIIIRDVVDARSLKPQRLDGMTVIKAPTVEARPIRARS